MTAQNEVPAWDQGNERRGRLLVTEWAAYEEPTGHKPWGKIKDEVVAALDEAEMRGANRARYLVRALKSRVKPGRGWDPDFLREVDAFLDGGRSHVEHDG